MRNNTDILLGAEQFPDHLLGELCLKTNKLESGEKFSSPLNLDVKIKKNCDLTQMKEIIENELLSWCSVARVFFKKQLVVDF